MRIQTSLIDASHKDTGNVMRMDDERRMKKPFNKQAVAIRFTLAALAVLTLYAFATFDYKDIQLLDAALSTAHTVKTMFFSHCSNTSP